MPPFSRPHRKHLYITASYLSLAAGIWFGEWPAFAVLFSYVLEFVLLVLAFYVAGNIRAGLRGSRSSHIFT